MNKYAFYVIIVQTRFVSFYAKEGFDMRMKKSCWKRKTVSLGLGLGLALAMGISTAGAAEDVPVGTVVDHVRYTDIVAYIEGRTEGYAIPTYNVSNRTVVAAADLADYGFNVVWDSDARTVLISLDTSGKEITANYTPEASNHNIGDIVGNVLATDIVTKVTDYWGCTYEIPSWNIENRTAVTLGDLAEAFTADKSRNLIWDETSRKVFMNPNRYIDWSKDLSAPETSNELKRGFMVKASVLGSNVTVEGEGSWGGVDNLTLTATNVSFSIPQRVQDNYDGCLDKLNAEVAAYDSIRAMPLS